MFAKTGEGLQDDTKLQTYSFDACMKNTLQLPQKFFLRIVKQQILVEFANHVTFDKPGSPMGNPEN